MKHFAGWALIAGLLLPGAGCDGVALDLSVTPSGGGIVTVTLVNDSTLYDVDVTLFFHDDDDVFDLVLPTVGTEAAFTLLPGDEVSFTEECDDLQAIVIDNAELRPFFGDEASTESDILREGEHFECGDEIVFTFTHTKLVSDFRVNIDVTR